jgi:hypothetical protein
MGIRHSGILYGQNTIETTCDIILVARFAAKEKHTPADSVPVVGMFHNGADILPSYITILVVEQPIITQHLACRSTRESTLTFKKYNVELWIVWGMAVTKALKGGPPHVHPVCIS